MIKVVVRELLYHNEKFMLLYKIATEVPFHASNIFLIDSSSKTCPSNSGTLLASGM